MHHLSVLSSRFPIVNSCARDLADSFHTHIEEIKRTVLPVEFAGKAGDVMFFHHRVLHTGSITCASFHGNRCLFLVLRHRLMVWSVQLIAQEGSM